MSGRLVAAVLLAFGAGWLCGVLNHLRRCAPAMFHLAQRLARAESNTDRGGAVDHATCEAAVAMLSQIVRTQAAYIEALESGADLAEQAAEHLREHGGGP